MILAMAATYDPDPDPPAHFLGLRLPCDLETGELIAESWARGWPRPGPASSTRMPTRCGGC